MSKRVSSFAFASFSLVALLALPGASPAIAQTQPAAPAIVLPPLPDVDVKVGLAEPASPAPAVAPSPEPAPAEAARPAVVDTPPVVTSAPTVAQPEARPVVTETPAAAPLAPAAPSVVQTAAPAPVAAPIDQALRAALEASVQATPRGQTALRAQREQLQSIYAARNFEPFWIKDGAFNGSARGALARLAKAEEDALDLKATPAPASAGTDEKSRVDAEIALTQAVIAYGRQASGGRIDPRSVARLITEKPETASAESILASVASAADADAALAAFNPPHAGYRALRAKLAEMRRTRGPEPVRIAGGPTLRIGMKDSRVPAIRARFNIADEPATLSDETLYDARVAAAVTEFQRGKGLLANGLFNLATVAALTAGDPAKVEGEIIANMERWRWVPRAVTSDRIEVNIPDYTVRVTRGGELVHSARVVVGKPDTPTPVFSNRMQFLEVNPYWNVPESIIKNEMMPRMAKDPSYLSRMGYQVSTDRKGRMVVRQPPGNRNALGFIKFMFPNEHAVYLHDTPSRALFANARRAYSHGCVRVDMPFKFAEIVLGKDNGWSEDRVKKLIGTGNRTIHLPKNIDVHIEYFTAFVDDNGELQLREDIYGYSRKLKAAMGLVV